jgi:hypothetical protein
MNTAITTASVPKENTLDELIRQATFELPDDWEIDIEINQGYAEVILINPNGSLIHMFNPTFSLTQQLQDALAYVRKQATPST